jgi:hypothetical protein
MTFAMSDPQSFDCFQIAAAFPGAPPAGSPSSFFTMRQALAPIPILGMYVKIVVSTKGLVMPALSETSRSPGFPTAPFKRDRTLPVVLSLRACVPVPLS